MSQEIQNKIVEIETRIDELNKVYQSDIGSSFKEASQTQDLISMLEKQKFELKTQLEKGVTISKKFTIKCEDGETISFNVVSSDPDRSKGEISIQSHIGNQLNDSSLNDTITFKEKTFKIIAVE